MTEAVSIGNFVLTRCAVVAAIGNDPFVLAENAKKLGADILEIRIDMLLASGMPDVLDVIAKIRVRFGIPIIVTYRMTAEGGAMDVSEDERLEVLRMALEFADAVDIELNCTKCSEFAAHAHDMGKTVIVSNHDFKNTPPVSEMVEILKQAHGKGADIAKLAVTPQSYMDVLAVEEATLKAGGCVCTIAMGGMGKHSRVTLPVYGSKLTYAAVGDATAPGQMTADVVRYMLDSFDV